jgi:branched-chain amino acid transport system substrate-binding protein
MKSIVRYGMVVLGVLAVTWLLAPSGVLAAKEIKIGAIYPLTGGAAAAGRELRAGAELSAKIANNVMADLDMTMAKNSGIKSMGGAKIELIFKDHQGNPTLAPFASNTVFQ